VFRLVKTEHKQADPWDYKDVTGLWNERFAGAGPLGVEAAIVEGMTTLQRFQATERAEAELAAERRAMTMRAVLESAPILSDEAEEVEVPLCIYCSFRPAEPGSDYCSDICAIDAQNEED
jgi:hypothetical protein